MCLNIARKLRWREGMAGEDKSWIWGREAEWLVIEPPELSRLWAQGPVQPPGRHPLGAPVACSGRPSLGGSMRSPCSEWPCSCHPGSPIPEAGRLKPRSLGSKLRPGSADGRGPWRPRGVKRLDAGHRLRPWLGLRQGGAPGVPEPRPGCGLGQGAAVGGLPWALVPQEDKAGRTRTMPVPGTS